MLDEKKSIYTFLIKNTCICWTRLKAAKLSSNLSERTLFALWKIRDRFWHWECTDTLDPLSPCIFVCFLRTALVPFLLVNANTLIPLYIGDYKCGEVCLYAEFHRVNYKNKSKHFSNDAFQPYYDLLQVN